MIAMIERGETDQVNVRLPLDVIDQIQRLVDEGGYHDRTSFILEAILEKLNHYTVNARFIRNVRRALKDPDVRSDIESIKS